MSELVYIFLFLCVISFLYNLYTYIIILHTDNINSTLFNIQFFVVSNLIFSLSSFLFIIKSTFSEFSEFTSNSNTSSNYICNFYGMITNTLHMANLIMLACLAVDKGFIAHRYQMLNLMKIKTNEPGNQGQRLRLEDINILNINIFNLILKNMDKIQPIYMSGFYATLSIILACLTSLLYLSTDMIFSTVCFLNYFDETIWWCCQVCGLIFIVINGFSYYFSSGIYSLLSNPEQSRFVLSKDVEDERQTQNFKRFSLLFVLFYLPISFCILFKKVGEFYWYTQIIYIFFTCLLPYICHVLFIEYRQIKETLWEVL